MEKPHSQSISTTFRVVFDDPFWVGIFERTTEKGLQVAKVTFGAEPSNAELQAYLLENYDRLKFSEPVEDHIAYKTMNPKRAQREAQKTMKKKGVGTKAQNILKAQYEEEAEERKKRSRLKKQEEAELKFQTKQEKKKQKRRGH